MTDGSEEIYEDVDVFEQQTLDGGVEPDHRWSTLPPSMLLSVEDADELLRWRSASVIAVVGERNGGKTTLISEIYEQFLRGPFAEALFCHSLSLLGFEMKSFQSRAESRAQRPDTPRTSAQDGVRFFHLALAGVSDPSRRNDLLISERAGEIYREIRDNPARASEMIEFRKALVIVLIIDGERVFDSRKRAEVFASTRHLIRALDETDSINVHTKIQLVTTKLDLLAGQESVAALEALTDFEDSLIKKFTKYSISAFRTAARDPEGIVEPATGIAPLLRSWLASQQPQSSDRVELPALLDEFDRLLLRRS